MFVLEEDYCKSVTRNIFLNQFNKPNLTALLENFDQLELIELTFISKMC